MSSSAAQTLIRMGAILRDPRSKSPQPTVLDGYPNIYAVTASPGSTTVIPFNSGINQIAAVRAVDGARVPAIVIASSPHKVGKAETPWQDTFAPDRGYVRYFGDNKTPYADPAAVRGNRLLLEQLFLHRSPNEDERRLAAPLILFRRTRVDGKDKGYPQFNGLGIVRRAELVVQVDRDGKSFANYMFEFLVLTLAPEHDTFDWSWINARRDPKLKRQETEHLAPRSWRTWLKAGDASLVRIRRDVQRALIRRTAEQLPEPGGAAAAILHALCLRYEGKGARFEPIAAWITGRRIAAEGVYQHHGVTRASGDRGFDFVGTLELGTGFGSVRVVVLGQAKCEQPTKPTNAVHVARTVARLRRGWVGAYVTTSYFSRSTQEEILEDKYPLLLIDGRAVAEELHAFLLERKIDLDTALDEIETLFGGLTEIVDPEQLTFSGWPIARTGEPV
jgi:Restriction endonuclease AspBHI N-terminal/Restriction endonuclease